MDRWVLRALSWYFTTIFYNMNELVMTSILHFLHISSPVITINLFGDWNSAIEIIFLELFYRLLSLPVEPTISLPSFPLIITLSLFMFIICGLEHTAYGHNISRVSYCAHHHVFCVGVRCFLNYHLHPALRHHMSTVAQVAAPPWGLMQPWFWLWWFLFGLIGVSWSCPDQNIIWCSGPSSCSYILLCFDNTGPFVWTQFVGLEDLSHFAAWCFCWPLLFVVYLWLFCHCFAVPVFEFQNHCTYLFTSLKSIKKQRSIIISPLISSFCGHHFAALGLTSLLATLLHTLTHTPFICQLTYTHPSLILLRDGQLWVMRLASW